MKNKRGISLITLVITIIVVIILAGAVIFVVSQNNPTRNAEEAVFKNDVAEYKTELTLWLLNKNLKTIGNFNNKTVNRQGEAIKEIITSLKPNHVGKFEIREGNLIYVITSSNQNMEEWARQISGLIVENRTDEQDPVITYSAIQSKPTRTTVTVNDPNLDESTLEYKWDTQNEIEPTEGWQSFTNGEMLVKIEVGTYYLWIKAGDKYGNTTVIKTEPVEVEDTIFNFSYTGGQQTFTIPAPGTYQLEVWGAQGGNSSYGGKGGYSKGNIKLTAENDKLYIFVGQSPTDHVGGYNGGGRGGVPTSGTVSIGYGGGGATDIRLVSGSWNNSDSLNSRIIVAGGRRRRNISLWL